MTFIIYIILFSFSFFKYLQVSLFLSYLLFKFGYNNNNKKYLGIKSSKSNMTI